MPVVEFHLGALKGKYVGETEQMTQSAIKGIKEISPCIVLVDEIEHAGFRPSGEGDSGTSLNQFTMMLTFMSENHGSILVGTTNQIDKLDPAFMRAGRLDYYIPMMLPDADARRAIWDVHTKVVRQVPLAKDVDVSEVVKRSEWYNGAEIELLVQTASKLALKDFVHGGKKGEKVVRMEHVIQAFAERKVDVEDRKKRTAAHKARAEQLCPQGIMKAAFGQDVDVQKTAMNEVMGDYRRDIK
jgi:transitional endoplasmic reticulum ATPase